MTLSLGDIPPAVVAPILTLLSAMLRLVQAGDDARARDEALMRAAEDLKAMRDRERFGPR